MAHSNYKVLTDVDLSNNSLLNVSNITNTEEASKSLSIETKGNTALNAASLTGTINGETSLETGTSRVTVKSTATETITTSKTTTVAATTETIDSTGIAVSTPSQIVKATNSSKVESPSITFVTGTPEGTGTNKQAKIALVKTDGVDDSAMTASAKEVIIDATKSITQTAPTSTYKTSNSNKIVLNSEGITLNNVSETVKLGSNQTSISGTKLHVDAGAVSISNSTTAITSTSGITAKTDAGSELKILTDGTTLKSPEITLNGTGSEGVTIKSGDTNSSSIVIKNTSVNIDSKDTLSISADKGITLSDEKSVGIIAPSISETAANGTIRNTAGTITLTTDKLSGVNAGSSTLTIDGKKTTLNTVDSTITATSITQTAPTSIYKADADNKLTLGTGSAEIKSGTEAITLTESASTQIVSKSLVVDADNVEVRDNKTLSTTSSRSVTVTAKSSDGTSSVTTNPTKIGLESKEVSLTASATESEGKKSSRITLFPAASVEEIALALSTDKNLKINSVSGATIEDNKSIDLKALDITETAGKSASIYSREINLQNTSGNTATERIILNSNSHKISIAASNAGVDVVGDTSKTVTVTGNKFNVNSGKSMFAGDSEFSKNVKVVGNLTTKNMTGEAAELNSLDVTATTTVTGNLETGTANFSSVTATGATVTGSLVAGNGLTARGLVGIDGVDEHGKSLTINETASTDALKVAGELKTERGGVTSAGSVSILNNGSADKSLTVNNTAEVKNLSVPSGTLIASSGMTSKGAVTVTGTTGVDTITGTGSLNIPGTAVLEATNGGTTGSVAVTETTIHTIKGGGSLEIPASSKLTVAADSTSDSVAVTSIEIATVAGKGSLEIPEGKKLTINNGGTSGTSATGMFKPTDVTINKIFGAGNLEVPGGKTLTVSNGGTINGSMTIGKAGSTTTNLTLNGNATIGTSGANETTLKSYAKIEAKSTLSVDKDATFTSKATFIDSAEVRNDFILGGVTIRWDSTLGALTFSRG